MATIPSGTYQLKNIIPTYTLGYQELEVNKLTMTGSGHSLSWSLIYSDSYGVNFDNAETPTDHFVYNNGWLWMKLTDDYEIESIVPIASAPSVTSTGATVSSNVYEWFMSCIQPVSETYNINRTLTHCTTNNTDTEVDANSEYSEQIVPASGYSELTYSVSMGGATLSAPYVQIMGSTLVIDIPAVTGDISITVTASSATYNVYYYTDSGMTSIPSVTNVARIPSPLPTPVRDGYNFSGTWYTNSARTTAAVAGALINQNTTLYAGWTQTQYTITLFANGGSVNPPFYSPTNNTWRASDLPIPTYTDHTFQYWEFSDHSRVSTTTVYTLTSNITLTAIWDNTTPVTPTGIIPNSMGKKWVMTGLSLDQAAKYFNSSGYTDALTSLFTNGKMLFNNPGDYIVGVKIYPFDIAAKEQLSQSSSLTCASIVIKSPAQTPISAFAIDKGNLHTIATFNLTSLSNDFKNYQSKYELYLPFYGFLNLDVVHTVGKTLKIQLVVDYQTGMGTYYMSANDTLIQTIQCEIGVQINLTLNNSIDNTRALNLLMLNSAVTAAETMIKSGGNLISTASGMAGSVIEAYNMQNRVKKGIIADSFNGWYAPLNCYIIKTSPSYFTPTGYDRFVGRPLMETHQLSEMSGFTTVAKVHVENISRATESERGRIESLLKEGVLL